MLRTRWIAFLVALGVLGLATSAEGLTGDREVDPAEMYWLGPYFAGGELDEREGPTDFRFSYGECDFPEGEGGCLPPVEVMNFTSCEQNPIGLEYMPDEIRLLRGGGLAVVDGDDFEEEGTWEVEVGTGHQTFSVRADYELIGAALREVRTKSQSTPQPFIPPVYPMPVLRELKRVTAVEKRLGEIGAIAEETGLSPDTVRVRLRIAELLGPDALADVPVPTMSTRTVKRFSQIASLMEIHSKAVARKTGLSMAELRKKASRVRGLGGAC